jgi:polar amino acid transport system substrate-binding protein
MEALIMKKQLKKIMTVGLLSVVTLSLLGACGKSEGKDSKEDGQLGKIKAADKLVLGTSPDFPPAEFYILKDGKKEIVGSDVALAQAIADVQGYKIIAGGDTGASIKDLGLKNKIDFICSGGGVMLEMLVKGDLPAWN